MFTFDRDAFNERLEASSYTEDEFISRFKDLFRTSDEAIERLLHGDEEPDILDVINASKIFDINWFELVTLDETDDDIEEVDSNVSGDDILDAVNINNAGGNVTLNSVHCVDTDYGLWFDDYSVESILYTIRVFANEGELIYRYLDSTSTEDDMFALHITDVDHDDYLMIGSRVLCSTDVSNLISGELVVIHNEDTRDISFARVDVRSYEKNTPVVQFRYVDQSEEYPEFLDEKDHVIGVVKRIDNRFIEIDE